MRFDRILSHQLQFFSFVIFKIPQVYPTWNTYHQSVQSSGFWKVTHWLATISGPQIQVPLEIHSEWMIWVWHLSPVSSPPAVLIEVLAITVEVHATPVRISENCYGMVARGGMMYKFNINSRYEVHCTNYKQTFQSKQIWSNPLEVWCFSICFSGVVGWYQ